MIQNTRHRDGFHWVGIWDTAATRISSCGVAGLRGESPSSRDPVPSSRRPSPAHTILFVNHSSDLRRTPSRGRKATRRRGRQRCGAKTDTGNCRQGSQEQLHRPDAGCRIDRRLLRIDRENRRPNCSCVSSRPSWHGRALRRRHLAPSDVVTQWRTVGSDDETKRFIAELPRHAVDLVIETPTILTFIEAKYLSDIDCHTTYDPDRGDNDIYVTIANVSSPLSATVVRRSTSPIFKLLRVKNEVILPYRGDLYFLKHSRQNSFSSPGGGTWTATSFPQPAHTIL